MSHERGRFPWSSFWFYGMGREQQVFPKRRHPCIMFYKKWHHHRFFFSSKWAFSEYPMEEGKAQNIWENFPERTLKLKLWKRIAWNFARWVTSCRGRRRFSVFRGLTPPRCHAVTASTKGERLEISEMGMFIIITKIMDFWKERVKIATNMPNGH